MHNCNWATAVGHRNCAPCVRRRCGWQSGGRGSIRTRAARSSAAAPCLLPASRHPPPRPAPSAGARCRRPAAQHHTQLACLVKCRSRDSGWLSGGRQRAAVRRQATGGGGMATVSGAGCEGAQPRSVGVPPHQQQQVAGRGLSKASAVQSRKPADWRVLGIDVKILLSPAELLPAAASAASQAGARAEVALQDVPRASGMQLINL